MITKTKILAIGSLAVVLLAVAAAGASAKSPKSVINLREPEKGAVIKSGSVVPAGWYVGLGDEKYFCQVVPLEEGEVIKEGSMTLNTNGSDKDKASGSVEAPPCYEEAEKEPPAVVTLRRRAHAAHRRHIRASSEEAKVSATGTLKSQEITTKEVKSKEGPAKRAGTIELSKAFVITIETKTLKCSYESKTKLKAVWPPEENEAFPNIAKTGNLVAEASLKLDKSLSSKTGCAKTEEAYLETWLGPLGEEFEAELVS